MAVVLRVIYVTCKPKVRGQPSAKEASGPPTGWRRMRERVGTWTHNLFRRHTSAAGGSVNLFGQGDISAGAVAWCIRVWYRSANCEKGIEKIESLRHDFSSLWEQVTAVFEDGEVSFAGLRKRAGCLRRMMPASRIRRRRVEEELLPAIKELQDLVRGYVTLTANSIQKVSETIDREKQCRISTIRRPGPAPLGATRHVFAHQR